MPNTTQTHTGKSLRERAARAAQLTNEQRKARDAAQGATSSRARGRSRSGNGGARPQRKAARGSKAHREPAPKGRAAAVASGIGEKASGFALATGHRVALIIAVLVVFLAVMLYPVGQTYYQSMRQEQRLDAQVAAVNARNAALKQENKDLKTQEGIEDAARDQGYVKSGDKAAVITNSGQSTAQSSEIPDKVDVDSIEAPHTWYYDILDAVFFVQYE